MWEQNSTQASPVLVLCVSKTAQTCHILWPSTAVRCPKLSVCGTRDTVNMFTNSVQSVTSSIGNGNIGAVGRSLGKCLHVSGLM